MSKRFAIFVMMLLAPAYSAAADISTHTFGAACNLPDTGQAASYTATYGEDHDYQPAKALPSFTVYNPVGVSSVTVDNRTGLMWITNPIDAGISGTYNWEGGITACESLTYAGYSDWRLPNLKEFVSILDLSRNDPAINAAYFLNTQLNYHWTATTHMADSTYAWYVSLSDGLMSNNAKSLSVCVLCVRGGP